MFSKRPRVPPEVLRSSRPLRNEHVTSAPLEDGSVLLAAPLSSQGKGILGGLARRMGRPDTKTFELEPVGALVWSMCDGRHDFGAIAGKLREAYQMNRLEAEASLGAFLSLLSRRRLITMVPGSDKGRRSR